MARSLLHESEICIMPGSSLEIHGRATPGRASLFEYRHRGGDILQCSSRAVEDRDLALARAARPAAGHDLRELRMDLFPPEEVCRQRMMQLTDFRALVQQIDHERCRGQ